VIGIVIVATGRLAEEFLAAAEHVVGPLAAVRTVAIGVDDGMEAKRAEIEEAVKAVDQGNGVIILTDMFGSTPSNLAMAVMQKGKVELLAGVNLPMLIKLATVREQKPLAEALAEAEDAGRKYVNVASSVLNG
jgi:mannose PTS system EIIA component